MSAVDYVIAKESDLLFLQDALRTFEKELKQLEIMHEWFYSEARPHLSEALLILNGLLEETNDEQDEEHDHWLEEAERLFAELCIDREGTDRYFGAIEDDEQ